MQYNPQIPTGFAVSKHDDVYVAIGSCSRAGASAVDFVFGLATVIFVLGCIVLILALEKPAVVLLLLPTGVIALIFLNSLTKRKSFSVSVDQEIVKFDGKEWRRNKVNGFALTNNYSGSNRQMGIVVDRELVLSSVRLDVGDAQGIVTWLNHFLENPASQPASTEYYF